MSWHVTVGSDGAVILPQEMVAELEWRTGGSIDFETRDGSIYLRRVAETSEELA